MTTGTAAGRSRTHLYLFLYTHNRDPQKSFGSVEFWAFLMQKLIDYTVASADWEIISFRGHVCHHDEHKFL
jgi:hypothetical protein